MAWQHMSGRTAVRVLYVDDEPSLCKAFARMFACEEGFAVTTATSPLDAAVVAG